MYARAMIPHTPYPHTRLLTRQGAQAARKTGGGSLAGLIRSMGNLGYVSDGPIAAAASRSGYNYQNGEWYAISGTPVAEIAADSGIAISGEMWDLFTALGYHVTAQRWQPLPVALTPYDTVTLNPDGSRSVVYNATAPGMAPVAATLDNATSRPINSLFGPTGCPQEYTRSGDTCYRTAPQSQPVTYAAQPVTTAQPATTPTAAPTAAAPQTAAPVSNIPGTFNYQSPQGVITTSGLAPASGGPILGTPLSSLIGGAVQSAVNALPAGPVQNAAATAAGAAAQLPAWAWAGLAALGGYLVFRKGGKR